MFVVCGHWFDSPGVSEQVYGPYTQARAETLASELNGGRWEGMAWKAVSLVATPWEVASGSQEPAVSTEHWPRSPEPREGRGRALLYLSHQTLEGLLFLPGDMLTAAVASDFMRSAVVLLVDSTDLPEVTPTTRLPELDGEFRAEYRHGYSSSSPTGWYRWAWAPAGANHSLADCPKRVKVDPALALPGDSEYVCRCAPAEVMTS
mgnify:FL=1